jgi:hypothetical protein
MDLKSVQRERLEKLPIEQKRMLLASRPQTVRVDETPEYFLSRLKAEPTFKYVQALAVSIRTKTKSWVTTFVKLDGLSVLFELLATIERKQKCETVIRGFFASLTHCGCSGKRTPTLSCKRRSFDVFTRLSTRRWGWIEMRLSTHRS